MPTLPTRSQQTLVQTIVAGVQGRAAQLIDFGQGSPLRAIAEGFAGLFLWFQALVLQLLTATRLSTSTGYDVDTFVQDFGLERLGAQAASGTVIFARFTPAPTAGFVPIGATVMTSDGTQSFVVVEDVAYTTFSRPLGGYVMAANLDTVTVPVQAVKPGSGGNVAAGAISQMTSPLVGIDTVINPAAFLNGWDHEGDSPLKKRFSDYILGLSRGDYYGLNYSIEKTSVTVQWTLTESYDYSGGWRPAYFYVVADDGSGSPSAAFMQMITDAANAVRPMGNQCGVFSPRVVYANVSLQIATADGYDHNTVVGLVSVALKDRINALGLGKGLPFSILSSWAYSVPGVTDVTAILLNGLDGDAASIAPNKQVSIKCNSCIVS